MPKNVYFWNKASKSPQRRGIRPRTPRWSPAAGGSAPRPPNYYFHLLL